MLWWSRLGLLLIQLTQPSYSAVEYNISYSEHWDLFRRPVEGHDRTFFFLCFRFDGYCSVYDVMIFNVTFALLKDICSASQSRTAQNAVKMEFSIDMQSGPKSSREFSPSVRLNPIFLVVNHLPAFCRLTLPACCPSLKWTCAQGFHTNTWCDARRVHSYIWDSGIIHSDGDLNAN